MNLRTAIDQFLEHIRVERGLASNTHEAYRTDLDRLWGYLTNSGAEALVLTEITPLYLKDFLAHLRDDKGYRPRSIARMLSSVRVFFDYCARREWIPSNPATVLRNPKIPKKLPVYLVDEEIDRLLRTPEEEDPAGARDRAILVTFLFTGIRLAELAALDIRDVDFAANCLRVTGKGAKERQIPLHEAVRETLRRYVDTHPQSSGTLDAPLFLSKDGRRMTSRMIGYVVEKAVRSAGISHQVTPHKLRHTFATQLLHRGANLLEIKELLGHSQIATTSIYTHTHVDRLRRAVDRIDD